MNVFQATLFPRTKQFIAEDFEKILEKSDFERMVADAVQTAFSYVISSPHEFFRVKSDVMNEQVFCILRDNLLEAGVISENEVIMNRAGNTKNCFIFGGYIFILNKEGAPHNDTKTTDNIFNQSCDKDIIQIRYVIDNSWSKLVAAKFVYEYGGCTVYAHDISLECLAGISGGKTYNEVEEVKISLKNTVKRKVENG